jgi:hypothetical protein
LEGTTNDLPENFGQSENTSFPENRRKSKMNGANINNNLDTRTLPIEIVAIAERGEMTLMRGDKPAEIADPRTNILEKGFVFLGTPDIETVDWEELISCDISEFGQCEGFNSKPGTIIPPLKMES